MGTSRLKIALLTSSRADYGIYLPLLKALKADHLIDLSIIAFGTHCRAEFGATKQHILADGFEISAAFDTLIHGDSPLGIGLNYAETYQQFTTFWNAHTNAFDWVIVLGDRYEMAAAVNAGIPFNIRFAHIHAGETTLGAIDNIYRHQISLASDLFFVSTAAYQEKIYQLIGSEANVHVVGALGLQNINELPLLTIQEFNEKWNIDLGIPTVLMTVHPETVAFNENEHFVTETILALKHILKDEQVIITLPNADTFGSFYRKAFQDLKTEGYDNLFLIENFGSQSYFSCMKWCDILIGNTSSGIIEAASFQKMVINLGNRQAGRMSSENVHHVGFDHLSIIENFEALRGKKYTGTNCYWQENPAERIVSALKKSKTNGF